MKIGMILDSSFPPDPRVENEALSLIDEGHEVHLFCLSYSAKFTEKETYKGIFIHRYYCNKITYKLSALAYTIPFYHYILKKSIAEFIATSAVEVIHIHDLQIARAVFWVNKKVQLPCVLDLHENRPEIMKYYGHVTSLKGKLLISPATWKKFEFKYITKADAVVVVTEAAKKYYKKHIKADKKYIILPNTVRKAFYESYTLSDQIIERYKNKFTLLYLGDTGLRRGTKELIHAVALVKDKIPSVTLVMVGKSQQDAILKSLADELKVTAHVDFEGWQDFSLFQSYIKASKIGFSPLHRNLHHDTTFANKIFQYMSLGLPVIVSDATAQKEVIEELNSGLVHPAKDPKAIAKCILQLYENQELINITAENAKKGVENKYNWEKSAEELIQYYNALDKNPTPLS